METGRGSDLGQAAEQLEALFEGAPAGLALIDHRGRFLRVNPALSHLLGRSAEDLLQQDWRDLIHPDDLELAQWAIARALEYGGRLDDEFRAVRPPGDVRWVRVIAKPTADGEGHRARWAVHFVDVTDRRVQEERLARVNARLAAFVRAAPDAIVIKDRDGNVALWNPAAERIFGLAPAQALGRRYEEVVLPESEWAAFRELHERVRSGEALTVEMLGQRADGSVFPTQVSAAPLRESAQAPAHTLAIIRDVTELVGAKRALAERAAQLERSNADLEEFAYAASHDLQEPLRSITMAAETVMRAASDRLDDDERQLLEYVDDAAIRMSEQVEALMGAAQVTLDPVPEQPVPAEGAVDDALAGLRAAIEDTRARVDVDAPLPAVPVPRIELTLVLQNLIANALKFARPGVAPWVRISGSAGERAAELRIADNGIGIAPSQAVRIFGVFQRGPGDAPGIGMGLAVVRRLMERRGGSIAVESEGAGRGAEFVLRWPVPARTVSGA